MQGRDHTPPVRHQLESLRLANDARAHKFQPRGFQAETCPLPSDLPFIQLVTTIELLTAGSLQPAIRPDQRNARGLPAKNKKAIPG